MDKANVFRGYVRR